MGQGCSRRKKWDKRAHKQWNGSRKSQNSMSIKSMTILSHWEKNKQQTQRGPTCMDQMTPLQEQQNGLIESGSRITERAKNGLKKGKPTTRQGLALEKKQAVRSEKSESSSRHNGSRMSGRMHRQASRPRETHK